MPARPGTPVPRRQQPEGGGGRRNDEANTVRRPVRSLRAVLGLALLSLGLAVHAAPPFDLVPLNPAAPNHARVFSAVRIGDPVPQADAFRAGDEMLLAVYAYLNPTSPVQGDTAYRDRLLVLLDHRCGLMNEGQGLEDISFVWQLAYAYLLLKHHRPEDISASRAAVYESALAASRTRILTGNPLLYEQRLLAQLWLNGDLRLAMSVYFGAIATGDAAAAEKARRAIDEVMCRASLEDGGQRYVGFWGEVSTYHEENVNLFIWWWKITGSPSIKAALDATVRYAPVANEPNGFTEQSSNIPYKHMYNNLIGRTASLWKAYLYDDGYNYFFGQPAETAQSTELLNAILYQPNRRLLTPPAHVGVFFDGNIQGPRGRFHGTWGWIAHGRDVQGGGPESRTLSVAQNYAGRQCGKSTLVGAFALGPVTHATALKGALDSVTVEFKRAPGVETDFMRGSLYRYLTQDENTATITRRNFGTIASSYRISSRTSANASASWSAGATAWLGQQVWVLTGERVIGLVQIVSDAPTTVYGLDARVVFTGGRRTTNMGTFLELQQPEPGTFAFGELLARVHASTFTGAVTQQRIPIVAAWDPEAVGQDDYSALLRLHDAAVEGDTPLTFPSGTRRWLVLDVTRTGQGFATSVINVLPESSTWAVLQFTEGARKFRIVQNLTAGPRNYAGNFVVGSQYALTSLHRSWSEAVTALPIVAGTAAVTESIPPWGHLVAVNSDDPDDHVASYRRSDDLFGGVGDLLAHALGTAGDGSAQSAQPRVGIVDGRLALSFTRARADLSYIVESSTDLMAWTVTEDDPGLPGDEVTVLDSQGLGADPAARFLRLRVTRP